MSEGSCCSTKATAYESDQGGVLHAKSACIRFRKWGAKKFDLEHGKIRGLYFLDQLKRGALKVYKEGATTGRTVGTLLEIIRHMPKAFYVMNGVHVFQTPKEDLQMDALGITMKELKRRHAHRWVGVVEWVHPTIPFSAPGDSGSLVYAMKTLLSCRSVYTSVVRAAGQVAAFSWRLNHSSSRGNYMAWTFTFLSFP
jgi:hypothetical protein